MSWEIEQARLLGSCTHNDGVALDQRAEGVIPPTDHSRCWNPATQTGIEHKSISHHQSRIAEGESAEPIIAMGIDASIEEHQVWRSVVQGVG